MSLLNNALREAEERQRRPGVTGAYTGVVHERQGGRRWLVLLLFVVLLSAAAVGLYWFVVETPPLVETPLPIETAETDSDKSVDDAPEANAAQGEVDRLVAVSPDVVELPVPAQVPKPAPEPEPEPLDMAEPEKSPEPAPAIKTAPQSPGAIDRQTAKELEALVASGRMVEAERRLASLTRNQPAPRSRFSLARALLVDGEARRALDWLPVDVAADHANVRMLRARAQHSDGRLDAAVATLESSVPAVADLPEYRITLATLLQQQGQNDKAAAHWAELIAWDDSRAPWWVGLAIALEAKGETGGATRAYQQAAALPGLPPSLADYVQRRLRSLRAG